MDNDSITKKLDLRAPFPWFGGKSRVADVVWRAFGYVDHYVEPFAGSLAVLLGRPGGPGLETVNDKDFWIAYFWRALQADPEAVAQAADWPVNEGDLTARHIYLVKYVMPELAERIPADPNYYDAKAAGWWVWGISAWIGGGWCAGNGAWTERDGRLVRMSGDEHEAGVARQRPHCVHRKRPHLGNAGNGVHRKSFYSTDETGVSRRRPHLGGMRGVARKTIDLYEYMAALADRLRRVRVCCGDWSRVVTDGALAHGNIVGVFLDPPYDHELRNCDLYNTDEIGLSADVRRWAIEHGDNPRFRIALCGYDGEHDIPSNWTVYRWVAGASYQNANGGSRNEENRKKETIWFSPHCLPLDGGIKQLGFLDDE